MQQPVAQEGESKVPRKKPKRALVLIAGVVVVLLAAALIYRGVSRKDQEKEARAEFAYFLDEMERQRSSYNSYVQHLKRNPSLGEDIHPFSPTADWYPVYLTFMKCGDRRLLPLLLDCLKTHWKNDDAADLFDKIANNFLYTEPKAHFPRHAATLEQFIEKEPPNKAMTDHPRRILEKISKVRSTKPSSRPMKEVESLIGKLKGQGYWFATEHELRDKEDIEAAVDRLSRMGPKILPELCQAIGRLERELNFEEDRVFDGIVAVLRRLVAGHREETIKTLLDAAVDKPEDIKEISNLTAGLERVFGEREVPYVCSHFLSRLEKETDEKKREDIVAVQAGLFAGMMKSENADPAEEERGKKIERAVLSGLTEAYLSPGLDSGIKTAVLSTIARLSPVSDNAVPLLEQFHKKEKDAKLKKNIGMIIEYALKVKETGA